MKLKVKQDDQFAKMDNEYGVMWYIKFNGGKKGDTRIPDDKYPSLNQIMSGLKEYLQLFIQNEMASCSPFQQNAALTSFKKALDKVVHLIQIPDHDKPFEDNEDPIYGLRNACSKVVYLVLWVYSIEPPLYFFLNQACRQKDRSRLRMLGPLAAALGWVLFYAE